MCALRSNVADHQHKRGELMLHVQIPRLHIGVVEVMVHRLRSKARGPATLIALSRRTLPVKVSGIARGGFPLVGVTTLVIGWST